MSMVTLNLRSNRCKYDAEFRKYAVIEMCHSPKTIKKVADDFGIAYRVHISQRPRKSVYGIQGGGGIYRTIMQRVKELGIYLGVLGYNGDFGYLSPMQWLEEWYVNNSTSAA